MFGIKEDLKRNKDKPNLPYILKSYFSSKQKQAIILYRLSNYFYRKRLNVIATLIKNHNIKETGCEIGAECIIGKGLYIGHTNGIVISGNVKIGGNLTIMHQVTIGSAWDVKAKTSTIGDNVFIGTGAKILGATIGNNVKIGANSVVLEDVPDNCVVAGVPAKIKKVLQ